MSLLSLWFYKLAVTAVAVCVLMFAHADTTGLGVGPDVGML